MSSLLEELNQLREENKRLRRERDERLTLEESSRLAQVIDILQEIGGSILRSSAGNPWSFRIISSALVGRYEAETIDNGQVTRIFMNKDEVLAYLGRLMNAAERGNDRSDAAGMAAKTKVPGAGTYGNDVR